VPFLKVQVLDGVSVELAQLLVFHSKKAPGGADKNVKLPEKRLFEGLNPF